MLIVILLTTVLTTAVLLLIGSGYSWFTDTRSTKARINSSVLGSYFQSGSGTEEDPYEVHTPIQLYYLAWLQNLGAFNTTYEESGQTYIKQFHFYLSSDLDMSEYKLPPIGTKTYPFVGNFNGQDSSGTYHKISNLTVSNIVELTDVPVTTDPNAQKSAYQIVGFFGIVGSVDGITDNTYDEESGELTALGSVTIGDNTYTYNSAINEVKNFLLDSCTIESKIPTDNKTLVGIAAGYINGHMSSVGVYNSSLDLAQELAILDGENITEKLSAYTLVGYSKRAIDAYAQANISGDGEGWGGSIDMKSMHSRLQTIMLNEATRLPQYVTAETVVIDEVTGETTTTTTATGTMRANSSAYPSYYYSEMGGSYFFADEATTSGTRTQYDEFYGKSATYWPKTVTTYTYKDQYDNGYVITDGTRYLVATNNGTSSTTNENDASIFIYNNNRLSYYVDINNQSGPTTYYLNANTTTGALTVATTASTTWTMANGAITTTISGEQRELGYFNNAWSLKKLYYALIKDGNNYLKATTTAFTAVGEADASKWYFNSENGTGTVWTYINNTLYYLYFNGTNLSLSTNNSTNWTWDNTENTLTATYNNRSYCLYYNGSNWAMYYETFYTISDGTNYINASSGTIANTTNSSSASRWTFSNEEDGGVISTNINGTTYYLYNNNGTLQLSTTNQTSWTASDGNLISGNYYINYSSGWRLTESTSFYIKNGNNYFRISGTYNTSYGNTTNVAQATKWTLSDGKLTGVYNNTTYYLYYYYNNTYYMRTTTSSATATGTWSIDEENGYLIHNDGTTDRYLRLNGTSWYLQAVETVNLLHDISKNVYVTANGTTLSSTTNANEAASWTRNSSNQLYTAINGTSYYIRRSGNNNYTPALSSSTNNTNRRYTFDGTYISNGGYYLYYTGSAWSYTNSTSQRDTFELQSVTRIPSGSNLEFPIAFNSDAVTIQSVVGTKSITKELRTDTASSITSAKERQVYTKTIEQNVPGGYDTYFPLSAETSGTYDVTAKNTGYIIGGTHASYQQQWGDVRVSSYYTIEDDYLSNSLYNVSRYDSSRLEVLTRTYKSNGLKRITDAYNENNTNVASAMTSYNRMAISDLGLQKYAPSREQFENLFTGTNGDDNTIYGMHFMDSSININNTVTAPVVMFNGDTFYDYEMPEDSIDFMLRTKGYINFFAGTYYLNSGYENDSFFALYEIERNANNKITAIKHISKIYGNPDGELDEYIYQYEGENTPSLPDGYVLMFDCQWIEQPTLVERAIYYYEVPVNRGEYALGSVDGRYGAYLIYLDISANGGDVENQAFDYLTGVDFVSSNDSANLESILTSIGNNNPTAIFNVSYATVATEAQKITFSRSADTIVDGKTKSHFTITGSTTNQSVNVKYYYVPADDKDKPEFIYLPT